MNCGIAWAFRSFLVGLMIVGSIGLPLQRADAKAFYSKQEALALAFPQADRIEDHTLLLTDAQVKQVEALAQTPVDSKSATFYIGHKGEDILGYAWIDTRIVRTLPETFLIVLTPTGSIQKLLVLAFYEPQEYLPSDRWLRQFDQKSLDANLRLQGDIHGIAGATLSARAVTSGVRKALALFQVFQEQR